jgi:hypothetical protein
VALCNFREAEPIQRSEERSGTGTVAHGVVLPSIYFKTPPIILTLRLQNIDFEMTYRNYNDKRVDGEQTNSQNAITTLGEENKTCLKSCRLF